MKIIATKLECDIIVMGVLHFYDASCGLFLS